MHHFEEAVRVEPGLADDHLMLGDLLAQKGLPQAAAVHYEAALNLKPANLQLLNNFAWLLATASESSVRNGPRAYELALQARRLSSGRNPAVLETFAAACAEAGKLTEAVASARAAAELAGAQSNAALVEKLQAELKLYEAGSTLREAPSSPRPGEQKR